jgi:hypothetical protein
MAAITVHVTGNDFSWLCNFKLHNAHWLWSIFEVKAICSSYMNRAGNFRCIQQNCFILHTEIKNYFNNWRSDFLYFLSQALVLWCCFFIYVHWQIWDTNGSPRYRMKALQKMLVSTMAVKVSTNKKCTLHLCKCPKYRKIVDIVQWIVKLQPNCLCMIMM